MNAQNNHYLLTNSPLHNLSSPHTLAKLLEFETIAEMESLVESGDLNYRQYREGGGRWIETPLPKLKVVQRRIHRLLTRIEPPPFLHSAYRGRSAVSNAGVHAGNQPMVRLDVRRFYPSSDGYRVFRLFNETFGCAPHVAKRLAILCTIGPTINANRGHLPTGGVTSPVLAYMAYQEMFDSLWKLAQDNGLAFSVLADDITFSGSSANHQVLAQARIIIESHGLVSNRKKERVWGAKHSNKRVTGSLVTPQGQRVPRDRKTAINELRNEVQRSADPLKRAKAYQRYVGSLSSAGQIEPRFATGSRCAMNEWRRDADAWQAHRKMSGTRKP